MDQDGLLRVDDVIVTAENSRLELSAGPVNASGTVEQIKRSYRGELLLDQETSADPIPDYRLLNQNGVSELGLASVLPFQLRHFEVRNIDLTDGFSGEFYAVGAFGLIDLNRPLPERQKIARAAIQEALDNPSEPERVQLLNQAFDQHAGFELVPAEGVAEGEATDRNFQVVELEDGITVGLGGLISIRTIQEIEEAAAVIAEGFDWEAKLETLGLTEQYTSTPERLEQFNRLRQARSEAAVRVIDSAVAFANSKIEPTADDFKFVRKILETSSSFQQFDLGVDAADTFEKLIPSIEREVTRLQFEAVALSEITMAFENSILVHRNDADPIESVFDTTKGFIDTFIARIQAGDPLSIQLGNTAVKLAQDLIEQEAIENNDLDYSPTAVIERIVVLLPDYEFDGNNLLPAAPPDPSVLPEADKTEHSFW